MSDKSGLAGHLYRMGLLLRIRRDEGHDLAYVVAAIRDAVPSCGVVPVDQRARLKSERYGQ